MSRRLLIPLALVSLLAASLTGCDSVRLGARCRTTALAHAGNAVVALAATLAVPSLSVTTRLTL